jgi:hypothetical protein
MRNICTPLVVVLLLLSGTDVLALPRFAAKNEQKCNLCHIDPTGGSMRNSFGSQYFAMTELAVHKTTLDQISKFQPNVSDNISIGADLRTLYIYDKNAKQSTFFQMESKLYVSAQVNDQFSISVYDNINTGFEVFGTGYYLPYHGYIRAGKFQPSYGWRFDDHTSFVRERTLWPAGYYDTGMEIGLYPYGISANFGFFNGTSSQFDEDKGKALAARLEGRKHFGFLGIGLGGSYWRSDRPGGKVEMYGPFNYINLLDGRLIHLGELDWLKNSSTGITSLASTQSLSFMISQGVWFEGKYDYIDPDTDLKTGTIKRYSLNLDIFPIGFLELQPSLRFYKDDIAKNNYTVFISQFHFFF